MIKTSKELLEENFLIENEILLSKVEQILNMQSLGHEVVFIATFSDGCTIESIVKKVQSFGLYLLDQNKGCFFYWTELTDTNISLREK